MRFANRCWLDTFGFRDADIADTPFAQLLRPDNHETFLSHCRRHPTEGKGDAVYFWQIKDSMGLPLPVRIQANTLMQADGTHLHQFACIREAAPRYREIFEHNHAGLAVYRPTEEGDDFRFVDFNRQAEAITNSSRDEVIGKRLLEEFPNMGKTPLVQALKSVSQDGNPVSLPPFYYEDATRRGFRKNGLFRLSGGEVVAHFTDTTEDEVARIFLDTLFDFDQNFVFSTINGEEIHQCNKALLAFLGYDSLDSFKAKHRCICERFVEVPEEGYIGPEINGVNWLEHTLTKQEKETVKAKLLSNDNEPRIFSVHARKIAYDSHERYVVMMSDITLLETFNTSLRQEVARQTDDLIQLHDLLQKSEEIAGSGSWSLDLTSREVTLSPWMYELLELPSDRQVVDNTLFDTLVCDGEPRSENALLYQSFVRGSFCSKKKICLPSGREKLILSLGDVSCDTEGVPVTLYGVSRDITDEERLDELQKENERLRLHRHKMDSLHAMFNAIAHHWRQPLSVLALLAYDLQHQVAEKIESPDGKEEAAKSLTRLMDTIQNLSNTINDFALFSHNTREIHPLAIKEVTEEAVRLYSAKLRDNHITVDVSGEGFVSDGNKYELMRVISGLIENGREAILARRKSDPEHIGSIRIEVENRQIIITDNGCGIDKKERERIFEPYYTTKFMGRGVGLTLYYNTIALDELFNAYLTLRSSGTDGSSFVIRFPGVPH